MKLGNQLLRCSRRQICCLAENTDHIKIYSFYFELFDVANI
jgi:hypothetical protein